MCVYVCVCVRLCVCLCVCVCVWICGTYVLVVAKDGKPRCRLEERKHNLIQRFSRPCLLHKQPEAETTATTSHDAALLPIDCKAFVFLVQCVCSLSLSTSSHHLRVHTVLLLTARGTHPQTRSLAFGCLCKGTSEEGVATTAAEQTESNPQHANRHIDTQTHTRTQTDRQTDRQTHTHTHTHTHTKVA